jgi:hypothetical protein
MIGLLTLMKTALKNLACLGATLAILSASGLGFAAAQSVTGTVTNKTTNKPSGNDDVVLLQLAQGMQELARTKTDSRGRFTIQVPGQGLHLLRVTHDKANYFQPVQPGTDTVNIDVYSAAAQVEGVTLDADVMRIETNAGANNLRVVEHFFVKNNSSPAKTLMSDHPFELYLPAGATLEGSAAKSPGGMAVQQGLVPETEPNKFTILFPIRPGETEFQVTYQLPYSPDKGYTFQPRPVMATDNLVLMLPKAMSYKPGQSAPYAPVGDEEVGAQTYVARNAQPSQPLSFTLTGAGQLPRDSAPGAGTPAAGAQNVGGQGSSTSVQPPSSAASDPSTDTRPGGGLGVPVDKDAERDPWTKYRWWIIAGLGFIFAAAAGFMLKAPSRATSGTTPAGPDGALQVLRDELFAVETDRLSGKLTEEEYLELKAAFDTVLKRTLSRRIP